MTNIFMKDLSFLSVSYTFVCPKIVTLNFLYTDKFLVSHCLKRESFAMKAINTGLFCSI